MLRRSLRPDTIREEVERSLKRLDTDRIAIWGDSFAPPNRGGRELGAPFDVEPYPALCEPLGGLLALLGGLFEDGLRALYVCGGLAGYASLLESPFCYVPHDAIVPGLLTVADISDVAAALAPLPLRMEALVDGRNQRLTVEGLAETLHPARLAYMDAGAVEQFSLDAERRSAGEVAHWVSTHLNPREEGGGRSP